jgi:hypothetical protein
MTSTGGFIVPNHHMNWSILGLPEDEVTRIWPIFGIVFDSLAMFYRLTNIGCRNGSLEHSRNRMPAEVEVLAMHFDHLLKARRSA